MKKAVSLFLSVVMLISVFSALVLLHRHKKSVMLGLNMK